MSIKDLVPKHKSDFSTIAALKTISVTEVKPILERLLEWIQDCNWPVAQQLLTVLPRFHTELIPHVKNVLKSNDDEWIYFVITELLYKFPKASQKALLVDIKSLAEKAKNENRDVFIEAGEFLSNYNKTYLSNN